MNRLSLWRAYVEGTHWEQIVPEARRGNLFRNDGSFSEIMLHILMSSSHAAIIPNDFFINHINLQHAAEIKDPNYPTSPQLATIARSALYERQHLLDGWPQLDDDNVVNLIRDGRLPSAILAGGNPDPAVEPVDTLEFVALRQASRQHTYAPELLAEVMGVPVETLGRTLPIQASEVADLLDIYALAGAAHDRGQSILDIEDMHQGVSSTSNLNEAGHIFMKHDGDPSAFHMTSAALWFRSLVTGEVDNRIFDMNEMATSMRYPELASIGMPPAVFNFSRTDGLDLTFAEFRDVLAYLIVKGGNDMAAVGFDEVDLRRVREIREMAGIYPDPMLIDDYVERGYVQAFINLDTPDRSPLKDYKKTLLAMREFINSDFFEDELHENGNDSLKQLGTYVMMKFLRGADDLSRDLMREVFPDRFRNADAVRRSLFAGLHIPQPGGGPRGPRGGGNSGPGGPGNGGPGDPEPA